MEKGKIPNDLSLILFMPFETVKSCTLRQVTKYDNISMFTKCHA